MPVARNHILAVAEKLSSREAKINTTSDEKRTGLFLSVDVNRYKSPRRKTSFDTSSTMTFREIVEGYAIRLSLYIIKADAILGLAVPLALRDNSINTCNVKILVS